jgi:serine/threonine-protein kinase
MGTRELRIGSPVLGYQVEALVGRGGMGVVYRVFDPALHRHVALKLIAPELALDEMFRQRFLQESRAVAALEHPNVVPVYSAGEFEDTLYLAMRYVEGSDLRLLIADGPLPPERAIGICSDVAAALDAAHELGLVHRDVKPSNILVGDDDHVYLGDFGLSRRLDADVPAPGTSLGTIAYVAPEQIRGDQVDGRADCYSLACVLYECLAGRPPFVGSSDIAVLFAHLETEPPGLPGLEVVLAEGLTKEPDERPSSCTEMVDEARRALGLEPRRRRWPLMLATVMAVVTVAVVVGIGIAIRGRSGSAPEVLAGRVVSIDSRSGLSGDPISIGSNPRGVAAGNGYVWVTTGGDSRLWKIDTSTGKALSAQTSGPPTNVAVEGRDVWLGEELGSGSGVAWFDGALNDLGSKPTSGDPPFVAADAHSLWASGPDYVYRITRAPPGLALKRKITTIPNPAHLDELRNRASINGVAAGPDGVWVVGDAGDPRLWRVDEPRHMRTVELGFPPSAVADGDGSVWVTDQLGDRLAQIDPATGHVTKFIGVGREPMAVVVGPRSGVWVANAVDRTVSRIDPQSGVVTKTVHVPFSPTALAVAGDRIWVAGDAA